MGAKRLLMVEKAEGPTEVSAEEEVVITMIQGAEGWLFRRSTYNSQPGGGGGSFNADVNGSTALGSNLGHGKVVITRVTNSDMERSIPQIILTKNMLSTGVSPELVASRIGYRIATRGSAKGPRGRHRGGVNQWTANGPSSRELALQSQRVWIRYRKPRRSRLVDRPRVERKSSRSRTSRKTKTVKTKERQNPMRTIRSFAWLTILALPLSTFGSIFQVVQLSEPAGFLSQTDAIHQGTNHPSVSPSLSSNGYAFGYWTIDDVRIAGPDGRSLTLVSSVIQATSTYKAHYFQESTDSDSDGIMDWFEYRMFGDLSRGPGDDPDGDGFTNQREDHRSGSFGQGPDSRRTPVPPRLRLCRHLHGQGHDQKRLRQGS